MELDWIQLAERIGQVVIVVLFLRFIKESKATEREHSEAHIKQLTDIGKECHSLSRESQARYQEQMGALMDRWHEDNKGVSLAIKELSIEVRALHQSNGR